MHHHHEVVNSKKNEKGTFCGCALCVEAGEQPGRSRATMLAHKHKWNPYRVSVPGPGSGTDFKFELPQILRSATQKIGPGAYVPRDKKSMFYFVLIAVVQCANLQWWGILIHAESHQGVERSDQVCEKEQIKASSHEVHSSPDKSFLPPWSMFIRLNARSPTVLFAMLQTKSVESCWGSALRNKSWRSMIYARHPKRGI